VRENRTHGSRRRELETEHPVMITAVKRPAGEPGGKRLRELTPLPVTQMVLACGSAATSSGSLRACTVATTVSVR